MRAKEFTFEAKIGTEPKRPARAGSRPERGHEPQKTYVTDRKTGKQYDPDEEFDKLKNSSEFQAQMKRMSQRESMDDDRDAVIVKSLPWPEIVNKVNSAMKATGWKGRRKDDNSYMFSTKGGLDDEWYIVIIENRDNNMFTYALGTVEEGDPHIGEQETLPMTEASVSELMIAVREGFGLSESEQFCEECGGSLAEAGKASRELCKSSKPDADLGASNLASCKSQGLRARDGEKSHKLGKGPKSRVTVGGHRIKGRKYGGPLPDYS